MKKISLLFTAFFCFSNYLFSQSLDTTFGGKGYVTTNFGKEKSYGESGVQVFPQNDGTCMVVAQISNSYTTVSHYLNNGKLDSSFGNKGYGQRVFFTGAKAVQQSDGKIVVAGQDVSGGDGAGAYSSVIIVRYNINGSLDSSFGINGTTKGTFGSSTFLTAVALDYKGNIVVAGFISLGDEATETSDFAVARYKSNGSLDSSFDNDGKLTKDFYGFDDAITSVAVQTDGKIILAAIVSTQPYYQGVKEEFTLIRLNIDGTFDKTFGKNGISIIDNKGYWGLLALQNDGKIVVFYNGNAKQIIGRRLNGNGSPDISFGVGDSITTHFAKYVRLTSIALQKDEKIVVSLWESYPPEDSKDFLIARYNGNGIPDAGFDGDGVLKTDFGYNEAANAVAIQSDGKIVAVGSSSAGKLAFARYNSNSSLDHTFSDDGKELTDYTAPSSLSLFRIATQPDGKILVGGKCFGGFGVARYNSNGLLDNSFGNDGKVFLNEKWYPDNSFIQVENDGSLDKTFNNTGILTTAFIYINSIVTQKDGKIVAAGADTNNGYSLIRYNTDGSVDKSFFADHNYITKIAIQPDGKIVGAGSVLVRFNTDGTIDNTFGTNGKQKPTIIDFNSLAVDVAGKIIVGGYTTMGNGYPTIVRFNQDGSIDNTFTAADFSKLSILMTSLVSTSDGKIIVTGEQLSNRGDITVIELKTNGSLDSGFNGNGVLVTDLGYDEYANALALYNNKLYVAGTLSGENIFTSGLLVAYNLTYVNKAPAVTLSIPDIL